MRRIGCLIALAVLGAGCGIPLDDAPETIAVDELPAALQPTTTTTTTSVPEQLAEAVVIYLVDPNEGEPRLVGVERQVALVDSGTELEALILEQLFAGPTNEEQTEKLLSTLLVPSGEAPLAVLETASPADGRLDIVLTEAPSVEGTARITAFAQVVFTLTELESVDAVSFLVRNEDGENEFISVLTEAEEGNVERPVGREDYPSLRPIVPPG